MISEFRKGFYRTIGSILACTLMLLIGFIIMVVLMGLNDLYWVVDRLLDIGLGEM